MMNPERRIVNSRKSSINHAPATNLVGQEAAKNAKGLRKRQPR
jgi:hypothetical protein